ncbi:MAG: tetraacyldisaccharide 4'-kinase [Planctomycetales bacterium]|nr:tetraacyldisaccharide 4'-kinase [Planctomycetales bacterium]
MDLQRIHGLLSGEQRGIGAALLRSGLWMAQGPYWAATTWRNRQFDRQRREIHQVAAPVISVGNITTGGTGKTPMVDYLARYFRQREVRVAIVSRGYGAEEGARNDEAQELERRLPDVPHLQNPDRFAAAATAIEELESQLILLDDGFQHRRLARDLDLVLIDALNPFGYGHLLPRGLLRESLRGLRRASALVLSRANAVSPGQRESIRNRAVAAAGKSQPWIEAAHAPQAWVGVDMAEPLMALQGKRVAAFCGIGNPAGFRHTLEECGVEIAEWQVFPDHHSYTRDDVLQLERWAATVQAEAIVCTEKDFVKLQVESLGERPLRALRIGLQIQQGAEELELLLAPLAARALASADRT